jgi:hypothetical protein
MSNAGLRPLRVGEILDAAIKVYLRNARVLMAAAASVVIPLQALTAIVLMSTYTSGADITVGFSSIGTTVTQAQADARLGASAITELASLLASAFVLAASVKAVSDSYLGQPADYRTSIRFAARRLLPLLTMLILSYLGLIVGFIALVIPGIWLYASWSVATPALLIEHANPIRALGRSLRLVRGRWWPTAGVLLISALMVAVIGGVIEGLLTAVALTSHRSIVFAAISVALAGAVSTILLHPFSAAVTTVLYYDLRVRHEGLDVQLLAEQLGLPEATLDGLVDHDTFTAPLGPEAVGRPGGPPFWPPPPGWRPEP